MSADGQSSLIKLNTVGSLARHTRCLSLLFKQTIYNVANSSDPTGEEHCATCKSQELAHRRLSSFFDVVSLSLSLSLIDLQAQQAQRRGYAAGGAGGGSSKHISMSKNKKIAGY